MIRRTVLGLLATILIAGAGFGCWWQYHSTQVRDLRALPILSVDLSRVEDGCYRGSFSYSRTAVEVAVQVEGHRIAGISVNNNRQSERARSAEQVVDRVIAEQSLDVDLITGASTTSKIILKAIEQALNTRE